MGRIELTEQFEATPEQIWPFITSPTAVLDELGIEYEHEPIDVPGVEDAAIVTVIEKGEPQRIQTATVESEPPVRHRTLSSGGFMGGDMIAHNEQLVTIEPTGDGARVTIIQDWTPADPPRGPVSALWWRLTFWLAKSSFQLAVQGQLEAMRNSLDRSEI